MINFKDTVTYIKSYLFIAGLLIAVAATAGSFAKLPDRVEKLEAKDKILVVADTQTSDSVDKLATRIDKYIAVQGERQNWEDKHDERTLKILDRLSQ